MKRVLMPWIIFVVFALPLWAQQSQVTLTLFSGQQFLFRNDYDGTPETMALSTLIGDQVPPGSQFIRYDQSSQLYLPTIIRDVYGSWGPAGTTVLQRGYSYWLRIPPLGGLVTSLQYHVTLTGAIPSGSTVQTVNNKGNALVYPYPVARYWTNTVISATLSNLSSLYIWDPTGGSVIPYSKNNRGTWSTAPQLVIQPGQGYLINSYSTNTINVVEPIPY